MTQEIFDLNLFLKNLQHIMKEKSATAYSISKKLNCRPEKIANILNGKTKNPTIDTVVAIAYAMECSIDELTGNKSYLSHAANKPLNEKLLRFAIAMVDEEISSEISLTAWFKAVQAVYIKLAEVRESTVKDKELLKAG